jgi:hypothetical protein
MLNNRVRRHHGCSLPKTEAEAYLRMKMEDRVRRGGLKDPRMAEDAEDC